MPEPQEAAPQPVAPSLDKLDQIGSLSDDIMVHLDAGYDSARSALSWRPAA